MPARSDPCPPRVWRTLIALVAPPSDRSSILRDLDEELADRRARTPLIADAWYRRQVLASIPPLLARRMRLAARRSSLPFRGGHAMSILASDVRSGWRQLRRAPFLSGLIVLILALGIGGSTAVFSLLNPILLRPLPFHDADRLIHMFETDRRIGAMGWDLLRQSLPTIEAWAGAESLEEVAAYYYRDTALRAEGIEARGVTTGFLSPNLLPMLGVEPARGRGFNAEEAAPGRDRVLLLSHSLWRGPFGGDPGIVGREVVLDGEPHVVIGVMGPDFNFPYGDVRAWKPAALDPAEWGPDEHTLLTLGRLTPGVTSAAAREELTAIHAALAAANPDAYDGRGVRVVELRRALVFFHDILSSMMLALLLASGFVVLIVCANVANLLLARARGRRQEIAVRTALGAGRGRILSQLLIETVMLAALGGLGGLLVARVAIGQVSTFAPAQLFRVGDFTVDWVASAFAGGITLLTALVFGVAPARRASGVPVADVLKDGRTGAAAGSRGRLGRVLVFGQVATATLLCGGAWMAIGAAEVFGRLEVGFEPDGVIAVELALPRGDYPTGVEVRQLFASAIEAVGDRPGVDAVGWISNLPLDFSEGSASYRPPDDAQLSGEPQRAASAIIAPGYLRSMAIPLVAGRYFDERDSADAAPVVLVNELLAARLWPGGGAVGSSLVVDHGGGEVEATVVGVAGNSIGGFPFNGLTEQIFAPLSQRPVRRGSLTVRSSRPPTTTVPEIRSALSGLDPNLPVDDVRTMSEVAVEASRPLLVARDLLAVFGAFALLLAGLGVYGVAAYAVSRRTHEIGVRMALGARPRDVVGVILRSAALTVLAAATLGGLGTIGLEAILAAAVEGSATPSLTAGMAVAALLVSVAALASWLPARRAARIDPMVALRDLRS